ncbi:MAG: hypothetical protein ACYDAR_05250 [Thermomicrobiales bacterium]
MKRATERQQWSDWVATEIGGGAERVRIATDAALAALDRGVEEDEVKATARASVAAVPARVPDDDAAVRQELLERIRARRASITAFARDLEPRAGRLANITIVSSALVTAFTAGPALGGTKLTAGVQSAAQLPSESFVWRTLCFAAMICSIVAIIATNMSKSRDVANRLNKAEAGNAALEGLDAQLAFGHLPVAQGVKLYQKYVAEIPFIPEEPLPPR